MAGVVGAAGVTGLDVDAMGWSEGSSLGEAEAEEEEPQGQGGWLSGITNTIESATGWTLMATAGGQKPKQPWQPTDEELSLPRGQRESRGLCQGSGVKPPRPPLRIGWRG